MLGLQIDRQMPGTMLAWLGQPGLPDAIAPTPPVGHGVLRRMATDLLERLPGMGYPPVRAAYLERQVRALETLLRINSGERLPFSEQAKLLLDIYPEKTPESVLATARAELEELLPGAEPLAMRFDRWQRTGAIPVTHLPMVLGQVFTEVRARTLRHLSLPDEESIELRLGPDLPYSAYTRYLGSYRSRIEVNTRVPLHAAQLVDYCAHEAYPGHHTEHVLREEQQFRGRGQGEYAIQLSPTPAAVIWEALATTAPRLLFDRGEDTAWLADEVLPRIGLRIEPERDAAIWAARRVLDAAQGNAALLLHQEERPSAEVAAYVACWMLLAPGAAQRFVELLQGLPWRVYVFTYSHGPKLVSTLLEGADRFAALRRLMTEPVYPALLAPGSP